MRATPLLLLFLGMLATTSGCTSARWNLAKAEDRKSSSTDDDTEVKYGNPWAKSSRKERADATSSPAGLPPELEAKLAAAKSKSVDVNELLRSAAAAEHRGDLQAARQAYQKVLEAQPRHAEAHHRLAVIADQQNDQRAADHHYTQALALDRKNADLLSDLGYSHLLRGNLDVSERYLKEALEVDNYHSAAIWHLGQVYLRQGKPDAALTMFRQVRTEREAQQIVAEAFPNRNPSAMDGPQGAARRWDEFLDEPRPAMTAGASTANPQTATVAQLAGSLSPSLPPMTSAAQGSASMVATDRSPPGAASIPPQSVGYGANPLIAGNVSAAPSHGDSFWQGALANTQATPDAAAPLGASATAAGSTAASRPPTPLIVPGMPPQGAAPFDPAGFPPMSSAPSTAGTIPAAGVTASGVAGSWPPGTDRNVAGMTADVARAAQLALGAGPGAMFPTARQAAPAGSILPMSGVVSPKNVASPSNDVRWAYGEVPAHGAGGNAVNNANWTENQPANTRSEPPPWNNQLAPSSPWNNWQSPAPPANNWMTPPEWAPGAATNSPTGAAPSSGSAMAPPPWPGGQPMPLTGAQKSAAPLNAPAPLNTAAPLPGGPVVAPPTFNNSGAPTTIPNWPYAPNQP